MSGRDLALAAQVLQCIMIRIENKYFMEQVVSPMLNRLNYGIEFDIVYAVTRTCSLQFLAKKGNWAILLAEDGANPGF